MISGLLRLSLRVLLGVACIDLVGVLLTGHDPLGLPLLFGSSSLAPRAIVSLFLYSLDTLSRKRSESRLAQVLQVRLVFAAALVVYLGNGRTIGSGDTLPARYLPFSILRDGDFYLDEVVSSIKPAALHSLRMVESGRRDRPVPAESPAQHVLAGRHFVSAYPVAPALLAIPFFLPAALGGVPLESPILEELEKLSAAMITGLSVILLYLAAIRLTAPRMALLIATAYALGSSSLSVSSQGLWQHGPSQLALCAALYCLVRARAERNWVTSAGLAVAFSVICRPTNVFLAIPLALYVLHRHRDRLVHFVLAGIPPGLFQIWYNLRYFGEPFHSQFPLTGGVAWSTPFWEGFSGLLVSPGRGLFVYSPILLLSLLGIREAWRKGGDSWLRYSSLGVLGVVLIHSKWWSWWGGQCYGPRLMADVLPVLCLGVYPVADVILSSRRWSRIAAVLALWSLVAHFQGAYWDDGRWTGYALPDGLWSWRDSPLINPAHEILNRARISALNLPTTQTQEQGTSASYSTTESTVHPTGTVGDQIRMTVVAANTGGTVWIAWPKRDKGAVQLEYVLKARSSPDKIERRAKIPLRHDVFPADPYEFPIPIVLPPKAGEYILQVGMVCNQGPSFAELGSPPLQIPLTVLPRKKEDKRRRFLSDEGG